MPKVIPLVVTDKDILIREKDTNKFVTFTMSTRDSDPYIPFFHQYAEKIAESQYYFKEFVRTLYGKKASKYVMAIFIPDDTSALERIFVNEFFLHSDACKATALLTMSQALSKEPKYISLSRSSRSIIMRYINNGEVKAERKYDVNNYDVKCIMEDASRIHIDVEYDEVPIFVNNFHSNMNDFVSMGQEITTKDFLNKIVDVDVSKE